MWPSFFAVFSKIDALFLRYGHSRPIKRQDKGAIFQALTAGMAYPLFSSVRQAFFSLVSIFCCAIQALNSIHRPVVLFWENCGAMEIPWHKRRSLVYTRFLRSSPCSIVPGRFCSAHLLSRKVTVSIDSQQAPFKAWAIHCAMNPAAYWFSLRLSKTIAIAFF